MKESTLLEMQNKIKALTNVVQHILNDQTQLNDLAIGTLEKLKLMRGYVNAKKKKKKEITNKENKDGIKQQNTK